MMVMALLGSLSLMSSCTVKEDRNPCPCILELDFICPAEAEYGYVGLSVTSSDGFVWEDDVDVGAEAEGYQIPVPQTDLHVRAWNGDGGMSSDDGLAIPVGRDCPRVYMHDSDVLPEGEHCHETVVLRKNHCVMTLLTEGDEGISGSMRLKGNVAGYDAVGSPLPGDFEFILADGVQSRYTAVLPRQIDDSLVLEIDDGERGNKVFSLGRYILSSGYDWNKPDLDDVSVTLDYALTEIRLVVNGWESVYRYDVEI